VVVWSLNLQLPVQSVPITNKVVSSAYSNSDHGEVHSIQHNVIKFVSDLRQVVGFLRVLQPTNLIILGLLDLIVIFPYKSQITVTTLRQSNLEDNRKIP
jgi:hypothetical protein